MSISGFTPTTTLPAFAAMQPGANPLSAQLPGISMNGAAAGIEEKPGLLSRLRNAMRSAVGELRGTPTSLPQRTLAMHSPEAHAPVSVEKPSASGSAKFPNAKTWKDRSGSVRELGTGRVLKPAPGAASQQGIAPQQGIVSPQGTAPQQQLPSNAAVLPGATVYSYDQLGNPVAPTMQQLGMTPTMLQGLEGMAAGVDLQGPQLNPQGPQLNATNQNTVGLGTGLGLGLGMGIGLGAPVIGQPINTAGPAGPPTPAAAGAAVPGQGGSQVVRNENVSDSSSDNQGLGWGGQGSGWGLPFGGVATPALPFGPSMTGAYGSGVASRFR